MDVFSLFFNMKICCVFSIESPHRDDSNEYTQYTTFNINKKCYSMQQIPPKSPHTCKQTTGNSLDTRESNLSHALGHAFSLCFSSYQVIRVT